MRSPASTAERNLLAMGIATGNTAAVCAMPTPERKQLEELLARLTQYRVSTTVLRSLLDEENYNKACDILARKYGLSLCSIFR